MHEQFSYVLMSYYISTVTPYVKMYVIVTEELFGIWPECNWDTI